MGFLKDREGQESFHQIKIFNQFGCLLLGLGDSQYHLMTPLITCCQPEVIISSTEYCGYLSACGFFC